jgi:predicted O-methyltransferase YrrM
MSFSGTDAHAVTDPATLPPLVRRALTAARRHGFAHACRPEQGRLLHALAGGARERIGETGTGCGVGLAWPASGAREGVRLFSLERDADRARLHRLTHVALDTVELRLAEDLATLVGTRRRLASTGPRASSE